MAAPKCNDRPLPAQPPEPNPTRIHKGDAVLSLQEMLEHCIPTARPLISLAELRAEQLSVDEVLERISRQGREDGQ
jgi:hypothetical protein